MADTHRVEIIAEMAWSHNGSRDIALTLVEGAATAGADAIGVHLTSLPDYMVTHYRCTDGVTTSDRSVSEIYQYLERLNLGADDWADVFARARAVGLRVLAMCNDEPSLRLAIALDADAYALAAACFTEYAFVGEVARAGKPVYLRVGGATLDEIERVVRILQDASVPRVTLLHGIQLYPTDVALLNISALATYRQVFGTDVGLADHISGDLPEASALPLMAIALGASAIEKHITVDRDLRHEDYEAALGITPFTAFVALVRSAERALGTGAVGQLSEGDRRYRRVSRKRVVAARRIPAGAVLSRDAVCFKRSDTGADPGDVDLLVGRPAPRDFEPDEGIDLPAAEANGL